MPFQFWAARVQWSQSVGGISSIGVEIEPLAEVGVPGDGQALQSAAGKRHQVLLQRFVTEDVGDLEVLHLTLRALGVDEELPVAAKEPRRDPLGDEDRVVEIDRARSRRWRCPWRGRGPIPARPRRPAGGTERHASRPTKVAAPVDLGPAGALRPSADHPSGHAEDDDRGRHDPDQPPPVERIRRHAPVTCAPDPPPSGGGSVRQARP